MIYLKTDEEIELMRESNLLVGKTLGELAKWIAPGITTLKLDKIAEEFIRDNGAIPGFLGYGGFPNTLCVSVNEVIVHGIPSNYTLRDGWTCRTKDRQPSAHFEHTVAIRNGKADILSSFEFVENVLKDKSI